MLSGISITCFAASYAVALLLEITRLFFRSGVRGALMVGFAGAGLFAHSLYLGYRAATDGAAPLSSEFDWYLLAAWLLTVVYIYLTVFHPGSMFGVFVLPIDLGLIGIATWFADRQPFARSQAAQVWGAIHGVFLLLGTVAVAIGFAGGVMCLVQAYRLKHKHSPRDGLRLPSLEWLERLNSRAIMFTVVNIGLGVLSGVILNLVNQRLDIDRIPWSDPIVWSSAVLLAWGLVAAGFTIMYQPARRGRKAAYLTLVSFVLLVFMMVVGVLLPSGHRPPAEQNVQPDRQVEGRP
jgi:ABC-type transport system involved in cytochrome c biogenesis permease subunit